MAVSASDIRSALSLPPPPRRTHPAPPKKPDGISRELYALIGPSAPSLAAHLAKPRLKQKPTFGTGGSVKWYASPLPPLPVQPSCRAHRPFTNSARSDTLQLSHWVKLSDPDGGASYLPCPASPICPPDYPFAKYNVQPQPHDYSQDEYTRLLEGACTTSPSPISHSCEQTTTGQRTRQTISSGWYASMTSAGMSSTTATTTLSVPPA